jgi:hypothetical protein
LKGLAVAGLAGNGVWEMGKIDRNSICASLRELSDLNCKYN